MLQRFGDFVVPSSFAHEFVPNVNVIFGRLPPNLETPLKNFLVSAALLHALDQLLIIDPEKGDAFFVETFSEIVVIIRRQFAFGVQPDFVQHSAKIEEAAHFFGWAVQSNRGHQMKVCAFSRVVQPGRAAVSDQQLR